MVSQNLLLTDNEFAKNKAINVTSLSHLYSNTLNV